MLRGKVTKSDGKANAGTVQSCSCQSAYQDKRYGVGNRLHTSGKKSATCTVCGKSK